MTPLVAAAADAAAQTDVFGAVGAIVAVLGVLVAIIAPWLAYRANHPRRQISYRLEVAPRMQPPQGDFGPSSEATLTVWCSGRADVPTTRFDGDVPLLFRFGMAVVGMRPQEVTPAAWRFVLRDRHELSLGPVALVRGTFFVARLLVEHPIAMKVWSPLIDTAVTLAPPVDPAGRTGRRYGALRVGGIVTGVGLLLYVLAIALFTAAAIANPAAAVAVYGLFIFLAVLGQLTTLSGVVIIVVGAIRRILRARAARRAAFTPPPASYR